jgi:type IV pilus assembly protein PilB
MHQRAIPLDDFPSAPPELDLFAIDIPREVLDLIPRAIAHEHGVIPVSRTSRKLVVALADPTDQIALDEVRERTGLEILVTVAAPRAINAALWRYYRGLV